MSKNRLLPLIERAWNGNQTTMNYSNDLDNSKQYYYQDHMKSSLQEFERSILDKNIKMMDFKNLHLSRGKWYMSLLRCIEILLSYGEDFNFVFDRFDLKKARLELNYNEMENISQRLINMIKSIDAMHDDLDKQNYLLSKCKLKELSKEDLEMNIEQYIMKLMKNSKEQQKRRSIWRDKLDQIGDILEL